MPCLHQPDGQSSHLIKKTEAELAKRINKTLASILLLINVAYFIPLTMIIIRSGGSWGYGMLGLPVTLIAHLFFDSGRYLHGREGPKTGRMADCECAGLSVDRLLVFHFYDRSSAGLSHRK